MMYNASEDALPDIDEVFPPVCNSTSTDDVANTKHCDIRSKYGVSIDAVSVAANPVNRMWTQGAPAVFLNNEACAVNRSLDALACAVRSCCDHANARFEEMAKELGMDLPAGSGSCGTKTATARAVMANENELCSRNIVLSAQTLMNQHDGMSNGKAKKHGIHLMVSAMEAFLENGNEEMGGFTEKQVKNLQLRLQPTWLVVEPTSCLVVTRSSWPFKKCRN